MIAANSTLTPAFCSETLRPSRYKSGFFRSVPTLMIPTPSQMMGPFLQVYSDFSLLLLFTYVPISCSPRGMGGGGSIMCPLAQRNSHFPADFEWVLSCDGLRSRISFQCRKWAMIKVPRQSFPLFIIYFLNICSLLIICTTGS